MDEDFLNTIDNYYDLIADNSNKMHDDELICECFCVSLKDIKAHMKHNGEICLEALKDELNMGKSCANCIKNASSWMKNL